MILESDPSVRTLLTAIVRRNGLHAVTPADGETAIAALMAAPASALVLDVSAPAAGGDAVLGYVREIAPAMLDRTLLLGIASHATGARTLLKPVCIDEIEPEILACVALAVTS